MAYLVLTGTHDCEKIMNLLQPDAVYMEADENKEMQMIPINVEQFQLAHEGHKPSM